MNLSPELVKLALDLPDFDSTNAQLRMAPKPRPIQRPASVNGNPRLASVLALLYPAQDDLSFVLIQRNVYDGVHSGQIGLPGGRREDDETFLQTALREATEEVGINPETVEILGKLTPIYIPPSDFEVHPFVGYTAHCPEWKPNPHEVSIIIETPLSILLDDTIKRVDEIEVRGTVIKAPYYDIQGYKVWGATAIILSELESRLRLTLDK